jgi:hypothetical protein
MRNRRFFPALVLVLAAVALARDGRAMVIVDYAFDSTNTTLTITSPAAVSIPPQGTLSGDIHVTYSGNGLDITDGPATLDLLNLHSDLDISTTFAGQAVTFTGPVNAELEDAVPGQLTGNQLSFNGALGTFHGFGTITCGGTVCGFINLPAGQPKTFDGSAAVPLPVMTVASLHGTITGLTFVVGGLDIVANLTFNAAETGRTAPEPTVLALGGLALGLAALVRHRRV